MDLGSVNSQFLKSRIESLYMITNIIDILRGMYVGLPPSVKKMLSPLLVLLPAKRKYGKTYLEMREIIAASEENNENIINYRANRLRVIFNAASSTKYYKENFKDIDIIKDLDYQGLIQLLARFPILTKESIKERLEVLLSVPADALDEISTGGSSGQPLKFYLDKNRSVREWAFIHQIWSACGYEVGETRAVLRGVLINNVDQKPWEYDAALSELKLSPFHLTHKNIAIFFEEIERRKINYIHGYPSAISILAKHIEQNGWGYADNIKGVFLISEPVFPHQQQQIRRSFKHAKLLPFYGMSEKVAIAKEVDDSDGTYVFNPLYGITELVSASGELITTPGEKGRIISTGLMCSGLPFIRYDTEDEAELVEPATESNNYRLTVKNIRPRRSQEYIVGKNGEVFSMAAINIHSDAYSLIKEFQLKQEDPGLVQILVVPNDGVEKNKLNDFLEEIQQKVGSNTSFSLKLVDEIARTARGKAKFIEQLLNLEDYQ